MKLGIITTAALLATISFYPHPPVLAQPSPRGNYVPGFWQPQVALNPNRSIQIVLLNQTGIPLVYTPTVGAAVKAQSQLAPRGTATIKLGISDRTGDIANVLINSPTQLDPLHYDFATRDNTLIVRIRRAGAERIDRAVYIDERGRVYAF